MQKQDAYGGEPSGSEGSDKKQENFFNVEIIPSEIQQFRNKFIHESKGFGWLFRRIWGERWVREKNRHTAFARES